LILYQKKGSGLREEKRRGTDLPPVVVPSFKLEWGVNWRCPETLAEARVLAGIGDHLPESAVISGTGKIPDMI
jgi:hypothetical protein